MLKKLITLVASLLLATGCLLEAPSLGESCTDLCNAGLVCSPEHRCVTAEVDGIIGKDQGTDDGPAPTDMDRPDADNGDVGSVDAHRDAQSEDMRIADTGSDAMPDLGTPDALGDASVDMLIADAGSDATVDATTDAVVPPDANLCPNMGLEICDGEDNDCDGTTDEDFIGLGEACSAGNGICEDEGVLECSHDGTSLTCTAVAGNPAAEICNGIDDDCDGNIDNGLAGEEVTCGLGACLHTVTACGAGDLPECDPIAGAQNEICDGVDNDCDGNIDNGVSNACGTCGPVPSELCGDRVDNDCDGNIDEGFPGLGQGCSIGVGACERPGTMVCSESKLDVVCNALPGNPVDELCDGVDNNCDGQIDEGLQVDEPCTSGTGACQSAGIYLCDGGASAVCSAIAGSPSPELCDNIDNNCDGQIDEGNPGAGQACNSGEMGICAAGTTSCVNHALACRRNNAPTVDDACNDQRDNDCDGTTDEGCICTANQVYDCYSGPALTQNRGTCRSGHQTCAADGLSLGLCVGEILPVAEICDSLDNDCDGTVDEDYLPQGLGQACETGVGVCQDQGTRVCSGDGQSVVCDAVAGNPVAEVCDVLDNDCDGTVDDLPVSNQSAACEFAVQPQGQAPLCARDAGRAPCPNASCICPMYEGACREELYNNGAFAERTDYTYEVGPNGRPRKTASNRFLGQAQRLVEIGTYNYLPNGRLDYIQFNRPGDTGNNFKYEFRYDAAGTLIARDHRRISDGLVLRVLIYQYQAGRIVADREEDPTQGNILVGVFTYQYDVNVGNLARRTFTDPPGVNQYADYRYSGCDNLVAQ